MMQSRLSSIGRLTLAALVAFLAMVVSSLPPTVWSAEAPQGTWAWGANGSGQLGIGTYGQPHRYAPAQVNGLSGVAAVAAGYSHSLAIKTDGTLWAWGGNDNGQLGDGTNSQRTTPVQVSGLSNVVAVSAGSFHSLALKGDGSVWAWGGNTNGQLGDGTTTRRTSPIQVATLAGVTAIAAGGYHSLALKSDGSVWAWGSNAEGQLGVGSSGGFSTSPVRVGGPGRGENLGAMRTLGAGWYHSLAVGSDGAVWSWGRNDRGQLGDGTTDQRTTPVQATGLTGASSVSGGAFHSLALKSEGTLWAWGLNDNGQLGNGSFVNSLTPVQVKGPGTPSGSLTGVVAASAGWYHNLALKSDGSVWSWGANWYGQLGDPASSTRSVAGPAAGLAGITAIEAGSYHSLAAGSPRILTVTWADPADIVYGTPLGPAQLNASASAPGSFSYNPPAGTVLNAGTGQTLSVTFTPDNLGSYTPVAKTVHINVTKAPLEVTPANATKLYGDPLPALTGSITGVRSGDNITASYSTTASQSSPVGSYVIAAILSDPNGRLGNYSVTLNKGTLTVARAPLTLAADNKTRPFGFENPPLTGSITGLKNSDPITASFSTTATASSGPGGYPIVPALADPAGRLSNYSVTITNGALTVEQPTYSSVQGLTTQFVTSPDVADSLSSKLQSMQEAESRDNLNAKAGATNAFVNLVNAQTGKSTTPEQAAILIAAVKML